MNDNLEELIAWKTSAWKDPQMVSWYSGRMIENSGTNRLKNEVEVGLMQRFAVGKHVLDVGVGTGRGSLPLARQGFDVTGVDSSQAMLDECRRLAGKTPVQLKLGDVTSLPVEDGGFDTLMALNVMTHFPHWQDVLREWQKKVRLGGRIVFDIYSLDHLSYVQGRPVTVEELLKAHDASTFNMHVGVEEIVNFANEADLSVVEIVPYGALFSGEHHYQRTGQGGALSGQHWWRRFISWIATDKHLFNFALFLDQHFFSHLTSVMTGRFMVVLDNKANKAANDAWLERNTKFNEMLQTRFSLEAILPYLDGDKTNWRENFNRHLDYVSNRVLMYFIWRSFWKTPRAWDLFSFFESGHIAKLEDFLAREQMDDATFDICRSWYQQPGAAEHLSYKGISLGSAMEYELSRHILSSYYKAFSSTK